MLTETRNDAAMPLADAAVPPVDLPAPVTLKNGEPAGDKPRILEEVVIEEVSIDGMCGVY